MKLRITLRHHAVITVCKYAIVTNWNGNCLCSQVATATSWPMIGY